MSRTEKDAPVSANRKEASRGRRPAKSRQPKTAGQSRETPTNRVYLLFNHPLSTYYLLLGATLLLWLWCRWRGVRLFLP